MDSITFITDKGQNFKWGGEGGSVRASIILPEGAQVLSFYGGYGGHIHNFGCYYVLPNTNIEEISSEKANSQWEELIRKNSMERNPD